MKQGTLAGEAEDRNKNGMGCKSREQGREAYTRSENGH